MNTSLKTFPNSGTLERLKEMLAEGEFLGRERDATIAWENGIAAGKEGKLFVDNPYPAHTEKHNAWEKGRQHEVARTTF